MKTARINLDITYTQQLNREKLGSLGLYQDGFDIDAALAEVAVGWAGSFDGSGDYLTLADSDGGLVAAVTVI